MFDLILGLNRVGPRRLGLRALMIDDYPPFRLDMDGTDPAAEQLSRASTSS